MVAVFEDFKFLATFSDRSSCWVLADTTTQSAATQLLWRNIEGQHARSKSLYIIAQMV
jgi:hypothetical protein